MSKIYTDFDEWLHLDATFVYLEENLITKSLLKRGWDARNGEMNELKIKIIRQFNEMEALKAEVDRLLAIQAYKNN